MTRLNRRSFLAASAVIAAAPALAAPAPKRQGGGGSAPDQQRAAIDAVIVGAGAAGIAAGRRLVAAGKRVVIVEAAAQVGGRCITDTTTFGMPYDRGAHWIYSPDINPVAKIATQSGLDIYPAPSGQRVRIGRRYAREGEMEDYLAALVRANNAIFDAARKGDVACAQVMPKDLGDWRPTIDFFLGPFGCGKDLTDVSTVDLARSAERSNGVFCRQGFGALLSKLAAGLPVQLSTPVAAVDVSSRGLVSVETPKARISASTAIVTVSTNVLASGKIKFSPDPAKRTIDAASRLKLGSYDHIALELPDNPLGLRADELVFEKANGPHTASIFANASGSSLCIVDVGGGFGRDLAAKGEQEMIAFALEWLGDLYGSNMKSAVKRSHATRWNSEPWTLGAVSAAAPGAAGARRVLMEPWNNRVWFAGEAVHEAQWGTVGGAWASGERAADAVVKMLGAKR